MKTVARGQISVTSIDAAYSVSLSSYETVIKGDIISFANCETVKTGIDIVTTEATEIVTVSPTITTHIQAFKGKDELIYSNSSTPSMGKYSVNITPVGCLAEVTGGVLKIIEIFNNSNVYVNISVNCEGNAIYNKKFKIVVVRDGEVAVSFSLISSTTQVSRNSIGIFEPGSFGVKLYSNKGSDTSAPYKAYIAIYGIAGEDSVLINESESKTLIDSVNVTVNANYKLYIIKAFKSSIFDFGSDCLASTTVSVVTQGQNAAQGSMPRNCGLYNPDLTYVYDKYYRDNVYFVDDKGVSSIWQVKNFGAQLKGVSPTHGYGWGEGNIQLFTAINTAVIENGDIGGFLYKGGIMQSRDINNKGKPNIILNGKTGEMTVYGLIANEAKITGEIVADKGSIGGFEIGSNRIGTIFTEKNAGTGLSLYNDFIKFKNSEYFATIGTGVFPPSIPMTAAARFEINIHRTDTEATDNRALYVSAKGAPERYTDCSKNIAIEAVGRIRVANDLGSKIALEVNGGMQINLASDKKIFIYNLTSVPASWKALRWDTSTGQVGYSE